MWRLQLWYFMAYYYFKILKDVNKQASMPIVKQSQRSHYNYITFKPIEMDFFSSLLIAYCIYLVVSTWTNSLRTANCVTFMCTHDNNTAVRAQRNILLLVKNIFFSANANLVTILRQLICSGGKWPALKTHVQTSWQYLRSTDLPSLLTQSSILVFRPIPHTALALNRHVLQSSKTNTHTDIIQWFLFQTSSHLCQIACIFQRGKFEDRVWASWLQRFALMLFGRYREWCLGRREKHFQ